MSVFIFICDVCHGCGYLCVFVFFVMCVMCLGIYVCV